MSIIPINSLAWCFSPQRSDRALYYVWQVYSVCSAAPTLIRPVIKISPSQSAAETRQAILSRRYGGAFHTRLATDVFCWILIYCLIDYSSHHKSASEWDQTAKETKSTKDWLAHYFGCRGSYTVDVVQSEITMSPNGSVSILAREMIFESFFAEIRAYIW